MTPPPPPQPHRLILPSAKEIQIVFNNTYIARTRAAYLVWERGPGFPPRYFIPENALARPPTVRMRVLDSPTAGTEMVGMEGEGVGVEDVEVVAGEKRTVGVRVKGEGEGLLGGYLGLEFGEMDAWLEDGALTRLPPKNPSRSIDTALVSRRVVVEVAGTVVAESSNAVLLFETGLPLRYYVPAASVVHWGFLVASEKVTACPYKGEARYFSVKIEDKLFGDLIWYYLYPIAMCGAIAGRFCINPSGKDVRVLVDDVELTE